MTTFTTTGTLVPLEASQYGHFTTTVTQAMSSGHFSTPVAHAVLREGGDEQNPADYGLFCCPTADFLTESRRFTCPTLDCVDDTGHVVAVPRTVLVTAEMVAAFFESGNDASDDNNREPDIKSSLVQAVARQVTDKPYAVLQ